jgi:hypothetical protein
LTAHDVARAKSGQLIHHGFSPMRRITATIHLIRENPWLILFQSRMFRFSPANKGVRATAVNQSPIPPLCRKCASEIFMWRFCYEIALEGPLFLTRANAHFPDSGAG